MQLIRASSVGCFRNCIAIDEKYIINIYVKLNKKCAPSTLNRPIGMLSFDLLVLQGSLPVWTSYRTHRMSGEGIDVVPAVYVCVCVCVVIPCILDVRLWTYQSG